MHSSNYSRVIDRLLQFMGVGSIAQGVIRFDADNDIYYVFEGGSNEEIDFCSHFPQARMVLNMTYFEIKVLIRQIKTMQGELNINGANKEDNKNRKRAGDNFIGLDAGTAGPESRGSDNNSELSRADDNDYESNASAGSGSSPGAEDATGGSRVILMSEAAKIIEENQPEED